ncbi:MAG: thiamine-phosphate kinase [Nitrospirae bacterium]|nr:MAG: thiamine-phosphate kinase [Nitrospirota bacterium]
MKPWTTCSLLSYICLAGYTKNSSNPKPPDPQLLPSRKRNVSPRARTQDKAISRQSSHRRQPPSRSPSLSQLGELGVIHLLRRRFATRTRSIIQGIGDDAAIVRLPAGHLLLASTDLLVEGIHFDLRYHTFGDIGYRAAVANLSDIAAMGGTPRYLLTSLALPARYRQDDLETLYQGLHTACQPYRLSLIGGDTSSSLSGVFLAITIIGSALPDQILTRQGARIGDLVYVTGTLGDAGAGLEILRHHTKPTRRRGRTDEQFLLLRHLRPIPRVGLARRLSCLRLATAAIDLSDGLASDLHHLCAESGVGARIWAGALPLSPAFRRFMTRTLQDALDTALTSGEDFELLFTASPTSRSRLDRLARSLDFPLTCIGEITSKREGITLKHEDGSCRQIPTAGYTHFRQTKKASHTLYGRVSTG